jgi:hypothetical protein
VIVDGMGCSGGWKTTTAAAKHSIHSTSLQDILLTICTTQTRKQSIEPQASNSSSSKTSRRVVIPLTHEHHMEQQGQAISW